VKKCSIMQPTYLPWLGYFNLIAQSDVFVFLDTVQYSKNSFHNRNKYPSKSHTDGYNWITVPVLKDKLSKQICETAIQNDSKWKKKHLSTISNVYGRTNYFKDFFPVIEDVLVSKDFQSLAELNTSLIINISKYLKLNAEFVFSSEMSAVGDRSNLILNICNELSCKKYLSPAGAKSYIEEDGILLESDLEVKFQNFHCLEYNQRGMDTFIPYMSIIDIIFNEGREKTLSSILK